MNKYLIPVCNIPDSKVYNLIIYANSNSDCQDKIMDKFADYSDCFDYHDFIKDLDNQDILIGAITDLEEL